VEAVPLPGHRVDREAAEAASDRHVRAPTARRTDAAAASIGVEAASAPHQGAAATNDTVTVEATDATGHNRTAGMAEPSGSSGRVRRRHLRQEMATVPITSNPVRREKSGKAGFRRRIPTTNGRSKSSSTIRTAARTKRRNRRRERRDFSRRLFRFLRSKQSVSTRSVVIDAWCVGHIPGG
jgi:hypothetical protein